MVEGEGSTSVPVGPALEHLERDVNFILESREWVLAEHWVYSHTTDQQRFIRIVADLWSRVVDHCHAIVILLRRGLIESAEALDRVVYEASIHLLYLLRPYEDRRRKALLYETRMLMELVDTLPVADETTKQLETIPVEVRKQVQEDRGRRGTQWCGKYLWQMAEDVGIEGHKGYFSAVSWSIHTVVAGAEVTGQQARDGTGRVRFVPVKADLAEDVATTARHTNRMLRRVYREIRFGFYLVAPGLPPVNTPRR